ncbi:hypothetical protein C241_15818 [Bradyrhizobium lupini HPC(L)]|uniref:Uncharacterized protein n=1 Tax=Bradyrhizobium lupini HPC(L) TaxID=1229491 RepID=A0ABP2RP31_RHILU|nr:hypothetical protein C241_15818 [Bradyrhizobium lupini HPC(L)]
MASAIRTARNEMADLSWCCGLMHEVAGDVLEQGHKVDFLLIVASHRAQGLLPNDCQNRLVVKLCVI